MDMAPQAALELWAPDAPLRTQNTPSDSWEIELCVGIIIQMLVAPNWEHVQRLGRSLMVLKVHKQVSGGAGRWWCKSVVVEVGDSGGRWCCRAVVVQDDGAG